MHTTRNEKLLVQTSYGQRLKRTGIVIHILYYHFIRMITPILVTIHPSISIYLPSTYFAC